MHSLAEPDICSRSLGQANAEGHSLAGLGPRVRHPQERVGWWRGAAGQAGPLGRGGPVGVPQHGVEGPGKVVGLSAAVVLFGGGQQAGQEQQQEQQQL